MFNFPTSGTTSEHQPRGRPCHPRPAARRSASQRPLWACASPHNLMRAPALTGKTGARRHRDTGKLGSLASRPLPSTLALLPLPQNSARGSPAAAQAPNHPPPSSEVTAIPARVRHKGQAGGCTTQRDRAWAAGGQGRARRAPGGRLKVNVRQRQTSWKARMKRGDRRESRGMLSARPRRGRGPSAGRAGPGRRGTGDFT